MTIFYIDPDNGLDTNDGKSFAARKQSMTSILGTALNPGDEVRYIASVDPTLVGNATWTDNSATITLASPVTTEIDPCDANWSVATNVVSSLNTTSRKSGASSVQLAIAAAFTTGTIAYKAIGSTLNLSSRQQISLWFRTSLAIPANCIQLSLCSDAAGATPVNTVTLPAIPTTLRWTCLTIDTGSALGASIASVRLSALTDPGAATIQIDHIIACNAASSPDSLTLNSLIGKKVDGETFYGIQTILGTTITLDADVECTPAQVRPYCGSTETVPTYKIQPMATVMASTVTNNVEQLNKNGTTAQYMTITGGWNRNDMSTQTGSTWLDGRSGAGVAMYFGAKAYMYMDKINMVRYYNGVAMTSTNNINIGTVHANNCSTNGVSMNSAVSYVTVDSVYAMNSSNGLVVAATTGLTINKVVANGARGAFAGYNAKLAGSYITVQSIVCCGSEYTGLSLGSGVTVKGMTIKNNYLGIRAEEGATVYGLTGTLQGNTTGSLSLPGNGAVVYAKDLVSSDTIFISSNTGSSNSKIMQQNVDGVLDSHRITMTGGQIRSHNGANRRTPSGLAWEFSINGTGRASSLTPVYMSLARVACVANKQATVSVWAKRIGATNLSITGSMSIVGKQIRGVDNDLFVETSAAVGVWEQLTLSFLPTETGVVEIIMNAYGNSNLTHLLYVDDFSFTQAA